MNASAVFFFVAPQKSCFSDINEELVNYFRAVCDEIDELLKRLSNYHYDKNFYYKICELDRQEGVLKKVSPVESAARFFLFKQNRV